MAGMEWYIEEVTDETPEEAEAHAKAHALLQEQEDEVAAQDNNLTVMPGSGVKQPGTNEGTGNKSGAACWKSTALRNTKAPPSRGGCTLTRVSDSQLIMFGGADMNQSHFQDMWVFNTEKQTWKQAAAKGHGPSPRCGHSCVCIEAPGRGEILLVYGGMNAEKCETHNDVYALDVTDMKWHKVHSSNAPPLNSHTAVLWGNKMVVHGGATPDGPSSSTYVLDLKGLDLGGGEGAPSTLAPLDGNSAVTGTASAPLQWSVLECSGEAPGSREMHSACLVGRADASSVMLVYGGRGEGGQVTGDLFELSLESLEWRRCSNADAPSCAHACCLMSQSPSGTGTGTSSDMWVYGGWDGGAGLSNHMIRYQVELDEWADEGVVAGQAGRFGHVCCAAGNGFYCYGGISLEDDTGVMTWLECQE
ncbi:unnamed protein product [Chrysoparadoxa australica]